MKIGFNEQGMPAINIEFADDIIFFMNNLGKLLMLNFTNEIPDEDKPLIPIKGESYLEYIVVLLDSRKFDNEFVKQMNYIIDNHIDDKGNIMVRCWIPLNFCYIASSKESHKDAVKVLEKELKATIDYNYVMLDSIKNNELISNVNEN